MVESHKGDNSIDRYPLQEQKTILIIHCNCNTNFGGVLFGFLMNMCRDANQLISAENILVLGISPIVDVGISCGWRTIGFCSFSIYTSVQKVKRYTFGVRPYLEDFKAEGNYIDWIEARVEDFKKIRGSI